VTRGHPIARLPAAHPLAACLLLLLLTTTAAVHAEPSASDQATAEALFQDAMKLVAARQFAAACPKLEQSQQLDPGIGTQFRLAECYEAIGRMASAWATFVQVASLAGATGQVERERYAQERASNVAPKVSRLTIAVDAPDVPGLEIRRGGALVDRAQWGALVPVDPAAYVITATAPGRRSWTGSVTIDGDGQSPTLTVPTLVEIEPARPAGTVPAVVPTKTGSAWTAPRGIGLLVAGAGVVSLGVGSGFGIAALSEKQSAGCTGNVCPTDQAKSARDRAGSFADVATGFFVAGGVLAAGGVGLWLLSPRSSPASATPAVGVAIAPGAMVVRGSW
jgi:hypothetical protein